MSPPSSERLLSLDAFRGLTITGMILVNNAGDWDHVFPPLQHAAWPGWTLADLIFPFHRRRFHVVLFLSSCSAKPQSQTGLSPGHGAHGHSLFSRSFSKRLVLY